MATKIRNKPGPKPTWETPTQLLKDFDLFITEQEPHKIKRLRRVKKLKKTRANIKRPVPSDYEWTIEDVEDLTEQKPITITHFAIWKGVSLNTITTGYSEGPFKEVYQQIKTVCAGYSLDQLFNPNSRNVAGVIFNLKNNHDYVDKTQTELSGNIDMPLSKEGQAILDKALNGGSEDVTAH